MTKIRSSNSSMIDDRRGQSSGSSGGGLGGLGGIPLKAGGGVLGIIILLAATFLPRLLNASPSTSAISSGGTSAEAADGTCSSDLEQIVCGATDDVQTFWQTAMPQYFSRPYEVVKTVFFTDATDTGCGAASSSTGPFYCPADERVYIDLGFMQQLEERFIGTTSDLAEQYIVAHEYGHHVQHLLGTDAQVQQAVQNDESKANAYSVATELQADCYAGVWVADANRRGLLDSSTEVNEALAAAAGVGDDRIQQATQGRIDKESWTHGSAEQRQTWFKRGFDTGDPTKCTTFAELL